ncbi:beta-lactamase [Bacterioplanes sanyensis]|uniref:class A beta-lactamase n=1 Tax=Bacterioplanes sanyensis TaxID=1249553 RepID=UPI0019B0AA55|nr:class A beta-lactamase [Bacterioplanes sanyensis]GGY33384.1 beta-lactamase [Bacterioplanes sanyensis]
MYCRFLTTMALIAAWLPAMAWADWSKVEQVTRGIERDLEARVGVALLAPNGDLAWSYQGEQRFALTSTFKSLLCAQLLASPNMNKQEVTVKQTDIVSYAPVMKERVGATMALPELCAITLATSDNSAANLVLDALGGPPALTEFLRQQGDDITRLDRRETQLNSAIPGDERDTTTPIAISKTLHRLLVAEGLPKAAQQQLRSWMQNNQVADGLLRKVLPKGWQIADRSGAGGHGARAITALVWPPGVEQPWVIAIYMAETEASFDDRNAAIASIGQQLFNQLLR